MPPPPLLISIYRFNFVGDAVLGFFLSVRVNETHLMGQRLSELPQLCNPPLTLFATSG